VVLVRTFNKIGWLLCIILVFVITTLMIFPLTSYPNFYSGFTKYYGLNNEDWIESVLGEKNDAMKYLKSQRDGRNLVEYPGKSFSLSNGISVFSGVPAILGWGDHEWLWRGSKNIIDERAFEIRTVYENPESNETRNVIKKYNIGWIIVGRDEKKNYDIKYSGLEKLGKKVLEDSESFLIQTETGASR
jgi:uncharacterized membrane protein